MRATSAVVTGAAGGIGAAVARRLLADDVAVTLTDLDSSRLSETAEALAEYGRVTSRAGDVTDAAHLREVVETAERAHGPVDLVVANAGVFGGFGLEASDDEWASGWEVNVMGPVRAAQLVVPRWLESGAGGCFVVVASAAGLLTQLGSAPYAVTKHAAVGFAEWLAATYGDRGVQVCCVCPMGVRTPMLEIGEAAVEADARLALGAVRASGELVEPAAVAETLVAAVEEGRFLALPHPDVATMQRQKAADPDRWLAGMQRFRQTLAD